MKKIIKGFMIFLGGIIGLVLVALLSLNILKFAIYSDFYGITENVCINPGLNDGFVPQGLTVSEAEDLIITSGYMKDGSASRLYITNTKNESRFVKLQKNGEAFAGHLGGVALSGDVLYLADGGKIYTVDLDKVVNSDVVEVGEGTKVNNSASFVFADSNYVYVGEFHDGGQYVTKHEIDTNDGKYFAICSVYAKEDLTTPVMIYSIRNKVQGFCVTKSGTIVLSTSYGLASSEYFIYEAKDIRNDNTTYEGAPLYVLDNYTKMIQGPAMAEGLSVANEKVYCMTESACNKYIFGKFFFANKIFAFDIK